MVAIGLWTRPWTGFPRHFLSGCGLRVTGVTLICPFGIHTVGRGIAGGRPRLSAVSPGT